MMAGMLATRLRNHSNQETVVNDFASTAFPPCLRNEFVTKTDVVLSAIKINANRFDNANAYFLRANYVGNFISR